MKKRLFRNLLMLGLLLIALTAAVSAVKFSGTFLPKSEYVSDQVNWKTSPSEYIILYATVPCRTCGTRSETLQYASPIRLRDLTYPVDGDYSKITMTINIPPFTCDSENCKKENAAITGLVVTFSLQEKYFCHSVNYGAAPNQCIKISEEKNTSYGNIGFDLTVYPKNKNKLTLRTALDPTCTTGGISRDCYYCDFCKQYFDNSDGNGRPLNVERPALGHDFDSTTGKCKRAGCPAQATASLNGTFKETLAIAVEAYNTGNGGELRAFITPKGTESFTLKKSGKLIVTSGVNLPDIILEGNPNVTIENAGTINAIKTGESSTLTINNSGTVSSIEMNHPGTLTIENSGKITSVKTPVKITGTGTRTINVTNTGTITLLEAPNTWITVQNDGEIGELIGYFHPDDNDTTRENMVTLKRGAGVYNKIQSVKQWQSEHMPATADFSKLQKDGDYFYLPDKSPYWWRYETAGIYSNAIVGFNNLTNAYFTGQPIASIDVTGTANGTQVTPTTEDDGSLSMTVQVGQTVALTGSFTVPEQGLKSENANISYSWTCKHAGSTTRGNGQPYTLTNIQYGTYELTLKLTDSQYNYTKSLTFYLYAMQPAGQRTTLYLEGFDKKEITKSYDGTTDKPKYLNIVFCNENRKTVQVESQYYTVSYAYDDPNCGDNKTITATVTLTEAGAEVYKLGTHNTAKWTSRAAITRAGTSYTLHQKNAVTARVGDSVFQCLEFSAIWYKVIGVNATRQTLFAPVTPGTSIMVEGDPLSVTFYRLHPANITDRGSDSTISPSDFIHDPSMNEELTTDSTFTSVGEYYVYAVVQPTRNFEGVEKTFCLVIRVQDTEASSVHHGTTYTPWDGTITASVPVAANDTKSVYLSSSLPTIYTELLLSQKKNLTLCLNGKTLSTTNIFTNYNHIRVTDGAALAIDDCIGTGTVKGAAANGGWGGIAYVKDGTLTIQNGKFTGGTASTGGGAIVVEAGGTLNISGGEISGNTVTSGSGGAIYIKSGGIVNIYGGTIKDNHVYSGNGGAIYVAAGGTLNLYGGTITGNTASGLGGGIYVEEGGRLNVKGAPIVTGNKVSGADNNVYLPTGQFIIVTDTLESGAQIGVSTERKTYTSALTIASITPDHPDTQDCAAYFFPDDPNAAVFQSGKLLALGVGPTVTLDGTTLTVRPGSLAVSGGSLFVAEYGADGRMLRAQSLPIDTAETRYRFTVQAGTSIKCFLLDDNHRPLGKALSPL